MGDRYQKGREEGMNQRSLEIARNMLAKGMDASTVLENNRIVDGRDTIADS